MSIKSIFTFVKSMLPMVSKDSIYEDIKLKVKNFDEEIYTSYSLFSTRRKPDFKSQVSAAYNNKFYRLNTLPKSGPKNFLFQIKNNLNNFRSNLETLRNLVDTHLENTTATAVAPLKKAAILKAVSEASGCVSFLMPLITYIADCEMVAVSRSNNWKPLPAQEIRISSRFDNFVLTMNVYCMEPSEFKKAFDSIPDIIADDDNLDAIDALNRKNPNAIVDMGTVRTRGFLGNPIYHYKMNKVEQEVEEYKCCKEMKKSLELKVMWLSDEFRNNPDPDVESEIEYLNDQIAGMQSKISEFEGEE